MSWGLAGFLISRLGQLESEQSSFPGMSNLRTPGGGFGRKGPRKIASMHSRFGVLQGQFCGGCRHLQRVGGNTKEYFKCRKYGNSRSEATDWRKKWEACGLFTR
jgi:hypothetical protein